MTDRPPFLWALSPSPRPRHGEKSPSTYLQATRELSPIPWALSSSPGVLYDNASLSTRQDTFTVNVSRHLEGNESQDDGYIELESSHPVSEREENDNGTSGGGLSTSFENSDITAVDDVASASAAATLPAAVESDNMPFSLETGGIRVELVIRELGKIHERVARVRECDRELSRIAAEVTALSKDANSKQDCHLTSRDMLIEPRVRIP